MKSFQAAGRIPAEGSSRINLRWLDLMKGLAIAWIFLNHVTERIFGAPFIFDPTGDWPPFSERLNQLRPLVHPGFWTLPANVVRYVGWCGDQGVQIFLIVSGFGLTWGLLSRPKDEPLATGWFYRRRLARIYPLWLAAHFAVAISAFTIGMPADATPRTLMLSALGVRFLPSLFYAISPGWWYVGLLLQLYLVFPLLWSFLKSRGPLALLIVSCIIGFAARGAGFLLLRDFIDAWQRGAFFVTRLPEFALGMALAAWMHQWPTRVDRFLRNRSIVILSLIVYIVATFASLTWAGMVVSPFVIGATVFVLLYAALRRTEQVSRSEAPTEAGDAPPISPPPASARILAWLGRHSYSLYLVHGLVVQLLVPERPSPAAVRHVLIDCTLSIAFTLLLAILLEWFAETATWVLRAARDRLGTAGLLSAGAGGAAVLVGGMIAGEMYVRRVDPQEILGWGERASLQPDEKCGWKLIPSKTTQLRWESYGYQVTANTLGYPGPLYPEVRGTESLRILTVGDAFTSAEGVRTDQAWPRLLESDLTALLPDRKIEVLNFGITGYGPNQYAAVVREYAARFHPDLILIGFFVNDYEDVLQSDRAFRKSIGFQYGDQEGWLPLLTAAHLRQLAHMRLARWREEKLHGVPSEHGYFLGNFHALERRTPEDTKAIELVRERLEAIRDVAQGIGAHVAVAMFPAPVQVCGPDRLAYFPAHVDLTDSRRFDMDRPQRITRQIAEPLGFAVYDLLPVLRSAPQGCPFQPFNMHWTPAGHELVARYLADQLAHSESSRDMSHPSATTSSQTREPTGP